MTFDTALFKKHLLVRITYLHKKSITNIHQNMLILSHIFKSQITLILQDNFAQFLHLTLVALKNPYNIIN